MLFVDFGSWLRKAALKRALWSNQENSNKDLVLNSTYDLLLILLCMLSEKSLEMHTDVFTNSKT